jgi:hypothetical protein
MASPVHGRAPVPPRLARAGAIAWNLVGVAAARRRRLLARREADAPGAALIVLAAIVAVQQLEGNVLYPVVVGPRLKLHPIVVLLALGAGGALAGLAGAFLAVPIATVGAAMLAYARAPEAASRAAPRFVRRHAEPGGDPLNAAGRG